MDPRTPAASTRRRPRPERRRRRAQRGGALHARISGCTEPMPTPAPGGSGGQQRQCREDLEPRRGRRAGARGLHRDPGDLTVSDIEVSDDGQVLLASAEGVEQPGLYLYSLARSRTARPARPRSGQHGSAYRDVRSHRRTPIRLRRQESRRSRADDLRRHRSRPTITLATSVPVPANYGIHDTFVRDGLAFVFAWNTGVIIYDVGNGIRGGSPSQPVEVSRLVTSDNGIAGGPAVHNGWWFHNPVTQRAALPLHRPGGSGDDRRRRRAGISTWWTSRTSPLPGKSPSSTSTVRGPTTSGWTRRGRSSTPPTTTRAWSRSTSPATLQGDLASRAISEIRPGGAGDTFTWGVQLAGGSLYASDMISGLWQLKLEETAAARGRPERHGVAALRVTLRGGSRATGCCSAARPDRCCQDRSRHR